jgi:outer membrane protein assembly factor BamA
MFILSMGHFSNAQVSGILSSNERENEYRIGKISIYRYEVFDPRDSDEVNWFTDIINQLHILSGENTIKSRLLFKEGDIYNQSMVDESCRILRSMGIVGEVNTQCDTVANHIINISVITHDKWTLGLNTSYRHDGGIINYGITIKDDNFLGRAQSISIDYNYSTDRRNPHGFNVIFNEPHLLENWWRMNAQYKNNEYLNLKTLLIERPFYSDTTSWSIGAYFDDGRNRVRVFNNGELYKQYDLYQTNQMGWGGLSFGSWPKFRLGFAYIRSRTDEDASILQSTYDNLDLLNLSVSVLNRKYYTTSFVENFGRTEDIPLGYQLSMTFGKNFCYAGAVAPDYFYQFSWLHSIQPNSSWYVGYSSKVSGFLTNGKPADAVLNFNVLQHLKISKRNLFVSRTNLILGKNWSQGIRLTVGSQNGLRGYPAYAFSGTNQLLFNFEYRFFSDLEFWIFRFGSVVFFDSGTLWNQEDNFKSRRFHSSAGFGLNIENTKQSGSGIIRIDFAFNFDKKQFAQVIISGNHLFRAFQVIDYIPASIIRQL